MIKIQIKVKKIEIIWKDIRALISPITTPRKEEPNIIRRKSPIAVKKILEWDSFGFTFAASSWKVLKNPKLKKNFWKIKIRDLVNTIDTASFRILSPNTNMFKVGSTFKALNIAIVATGSTADTREPYAKLKAKYKVVI